MMKEIEDMSSDDDETSALIADEDDDAAQRKSARNKRAASSDLRGRGSKKGSGRALGGSTFASADDFGAEVDEWHSQLVQVQSTAVACDLHLICFYFS
jgi:hypothetical protein